MNQLFYNIFNSMENFFSGDMFVDIMSVHACTIEFDQTNLLDML